MKTNHELRVQTFIFSMTDQNTVDYDKWLEIHAEIFKNHNFPVDKLGEKLYKKLIDQCFDAGNYFGIDTQGDPTLIYTPKEDAPPLTAFSNIFIADHCWSPEPLTLYKEWKENKELRERLDMYTSYADDDDESLTLEERMEKCDGKVLELDDLDLTELKSLNIPERFPQLEALSIYGNQVEDPAEVLATIAALPNLRGLWINDNPVVDAPAIDESILSCCPKLEILNSNLTKNYTEWALLYIAHSKDAKTVTTIDLSGRELHALNPNAFKPFLNLSKADFRENDVDLSKVNEIIPNLRSVYCDNPEQLPNTFVFVNGKDTETGDETISIPNRIWDHIQPAGNRWGLGDEVALAIHHSLTPNFATMPCGSPSSALTYFIFWPIEDISPMDEVTSNLFPQIEFGEESEPEAPIPMRSVKSKFVSTVVRKRPIKVYTDIGVFAKNLHSDKFEVVQDPNEADLQWIGYHDTHDFQPIYDNKIYFNQIENERYITVKDLMYLTVKTYMGPVPWLPETFVLDEPDDVASFLKRDKELKSSNQSSAWIVKAFNQTRAAFMIVTESTSEVLRHASVDKRLTQRYLWNPLLIYGLKFDLRYIVLLKSVMPMELYAYKVFWPRMAPKRWALDDFDDYERHFTVMNYRAPDKITHKTYVDFIEQFGIENPNVKWDDVQQKIYIVFRDLFKCACQKMVASPYTKAMYGIDLMLTNEMEPVILECNFQPDCKRACNLCPTFVDDVFEVLYTDQPVTNDKVTFIPLD